jgi:DNA primase
MTAPISNKTLSKASHLNARELKSRVDLVLFAGQFTPLRRSGRQFLGLCPLHTERHPSFYVHPVKQVFKCFGCGVGGDLFAFVMRVEGCGFLDALRIVAEFSDGGSQRQRAGC